MTTDSERARRILDAHGTTFAAEAGITLRDEPAPLWQLLVLTLLLSRRISSDVAVATARELWRAGWRTPAHLRDSTRRERVAALGRGGYRRYDESTATRLEAAATLVHERWGDDLRRLREAADGETGGDPGGDPDRDADRVPDRVAALVREVDGIGPTGAAIFCREVQAVWPRLRPYADPLVLRGAQAAGLPADARRLADLVGHQGDDAMARLAAALVRIARRPALLDP